MDHSNTSSQGCVVGKTVYSYMLILCNAVTKNNVFFFFVKPRFLRNQNLMAEKFRNLMNFSHLDKCWPVTCTSKLVTTQLSNIPDHTNNAQGNGNGPWPERFLTFQSLNHSITQFPFINSKKTLYFSISNSLPPLHSFSPLIGNKGIQNGWQSYLTPC